MLSSRIGCLIAGLSLACLMCLTPAVRAEDASGITVSGSGKASAKPTSVEIPCIVSGDAELTADAIVKYRDARKRAVDAIQGLKIAGLTVESKGYSVRDYVDAVAQQQAMMRGQAVVQHQAEGFRDRADSHRDQGCGQDGARRR